MDRKPQPGKGRVRKSPEDREMNSTSSRGSIQAGRARQERRAPSLGQKRALRAERGGGS